MTKLLTATALGASMVLSTGRSWAFAPETTMPLDLLESKGGITSKKVDEFTKTSAAEMANNSDINGHYHSVKSLADKTESLVVNEQEQNFLGDKIRWSGLVEAEMSTSRTKGSDGTKTNSNDLSLATAQLDIETEINQYLNGRLVFLYEEAANNDNIAINQAIIVLKANNNSPLYVNIGRQYVPFGRFESHFVSDPGTLALGETNDTAIVAGFANDVVELAIGGFKGKTKESGTDNQINSAVVSATMTMPTSNLDGWSLNGGVSYLSNLAASDSLEAETVTAGEITEMVGGWSTFISLGYGDRFFLDAEYLGAIKKFAINDFSFTNVDNLRPKAWNLEAAARICESAELAFRYGGSDETGSLLAKEEYGAALLYNIWRSTNLTLEFLHQKFIDNENNNQGTIQIALEF